MQSQPIRWTTRREVVDALIAFVRASAPSEERSNAVSVLAALVEPADAEACVALVLAHDLEIEERARLLDALGRVGHRLSAEQSRALCERGLPRSLTPFERVLDPVVAEEVLPSWLDGLSDDVMPYEVTKWMSAPAGTLSASAFALALRRQRVHARYGSMAWRVPACFDQWMESRAELDARNVVRALQQDEHEFVRQLSRHTSRRGELARRFLLPLEDLEKFFGAATLLAMLSDALRAEEARSEHEEAARAARNERDAWIRARRERNEPVVGVVHSKVKGGLSVVVGPVRCFLPGSQTLLVADRQAELVGKTLAFRVLKAWPEGTNIILTLRDVSSKPALQHPATGDDTVIGWPVDGDTVGLFRTIASSELAGDLRARALRGAGLLADRMYRAWRELDAPAALAWAMSQPVTSLSESPRADRLHPDALDEELRLALAWSAPPSVRTAALEVIRRTDGGSVRFSEEVRSIAWRTRPNGHDDLCALGILAADGDRSALDALVDVVENERDIMREEIAFDLAFPRRAPWAHERELLLRILDHVVVGPDAAERLVRGGNVEDLDAVLQRALERPSYCRAFRALAAARP